MKKTATYLVVFLMSITFISAREIKVVSYVEGIDFDNVDSNLLDIKEVIIVDCATGQMQEGNMVAPGVITLPDMYKEEVFVSYIEGEIRKEYYIPKFRKRALIGVPINGDYECTMYVNYPYCDVISPGSQFGTGCDSYTYILTNYCSNSSVIRFPGIRINYIYEDYSNYVDEVFSWNSTFSKSYCDEEFVLSFCETMPVIKNEDEFVEQLQLRHLLGKKGTFVIQFGVNCEGDIVLTKIVSNKTNTTNNQLRRIFTNMQKFTPAQHDGQFVDARYSIRYRIRNDWIRRLR